MAAHRSFGGQGASYEISTSRYEVLGKLASGGMGTVHLARMRGSLGFTKLVAIKTMHPRHATDPAAAALFLDEAQVTAHLRHPNIVGAVDFVAERGELMLVMDYVEGDSLRALQKASAHANERIPVTVACAIARDILHGLHAAHEARDDFNRSLGIIHRDVSPDNMMVGVDGVARVLDFGVARARCAAVADGDTAVRGKVVYMAPEQLTGRHDLVDRSVDVYAVGAVLWELLTGRRLFRSGANASPRALTEMIMKQPVTAPSAVALGIPSALDAIILAMVSRDPRKRPRTALEAARAIESAIPAIASAYDVGVFVKRFARPRPIPRRRATTTTTTTGPASSRDPRSEFEVPTLSGVARTTTSSISISSALQRPAKKKTWDAPLFATAAAVVLAAITTLTFTIHQSRHATSAATATAKLQCR